jgi:hypothetical protein
LGEEGIEIAGNEKGFFWGDDVQCNDLGLRYTGISSRGVGRG